MDTTSAAIAKCAIHSTLVLFSSFFHSRRLNMGLKIDRYAAETLPQDCEDSLPSRPAPIAPKQGIDIKPYYPPPPFPTALTVKERIAQDETLSTSGEKTVYEPRKHEGTGVDEEELLYESYLLPVDEAITRLKHSIMGDVVRRGWEAVLLRMEIEEASG